jgi:hypothetical protein
MHLISLIELITQISDFAKYLNLTLVAADNFDRFCASAFNRTVLGCCAYKGMAEIAKIATTVAVVATTPRPKM